MPGRRSSQKGLEAKLDSVRTLANAFRSIGHTSFVARCRKVHLGMGLAFESELVTQAPLPFGIS